MGAIKERGRREKKDELKVTYPQSLFPAPSLLQLKLNQRHLIN
jgi:hypothetical protein